MNDGPDYKQQVVALNQWLDTELGQMVLEQESRVLQQLVQNLFGYYMAEVGLLCRHLDYMQSCPVRSFVRVSLCRDENSELVSLPEQLPLATDYMDAVVLPHTLDFALDPRQVLREVERILIPEGRVVITGFNPYSFWGLWRMMAGAEKRLPWKGHFIPYARLQDWLSLLGFEVEQTQTLLFRPPWKNAFLKQCFPRLDRIGQRWWPRFAGVYAIVAVKRVSTLTPIRPRWYLERKLRNAAVQPVANCSQGKLEK
ncbi:MAG TPA: methyltransferase domain-containing protein [Thiolapillus brandeum]|uniref:Methyltransferase domain-containing protein n=1 Tax=Thiolapillus brandeum TaxID=1076588 RepID=A0A831NSZ4_9GAMM|nr:methyltransferase domain-containing protein [Thiolapillus brandeum]